MFVTAKMLTKVDYCVTESLVTIFVLNNEIFYQHFNRINNYLFDFNTLYDLCSKSI